MMKGEKGMKVLKIKDGRGYFNRNNEDFSIDEITSDDILSLLDCACSDVEFEMDDNFDNLKNEAHKIIYQNLYEQFKIFLNDRLQFKNKCDNLFSEALNKYE